MKKIAAIMLTLITVLSALSSCSSVKLKKEAEIIQDMNENKTVKDGYISQCRYVENDDYTVETFEIMRRQTNMDKKEDIIIGNATIKNSYFSTDIVCKLTYNYYETGGWALDECEFLTDDTPPTSCPLQGIDTDRIEFEGLSTKDYEGYKISCSYLDSDRMIAEEQDFSQSNDGWSTNVLCVYYGNHYTVTAKMYFVFDQKQGWIIDSNVHGMSRNISAILTDITCDFTALVGTFVKDTPNIADKNSDYLIIDSFDEETNEIKGSYIADARDQNIVSDFTAVFNTIEMKMEIEYYNIDNRKIGSCFSYNFVTDEWRNNAIWLASYVRQ